MDKERFVTRREKRQILRNLNDPYYLTFTMKNTNQTWGNPLKSRYGRTKLTEQKLKSKQKIDILSKQNQNLKNIKLKKICNF